MNISKEIFREYDVRGIVGRDLTDEIAFHLGRAVASLVLREGGSRILVGRDCRASGDDFSKALINGLMESGVSAIDGGVMSTPVNYWGIQHLKTDGGVQITGSHNPPDYNGFKLTLMGRSVHGEEIQHIREMIENEDYENQDKSHQGKTEKADLLEKYVADLAKILRTGGRKLKVVVDAGKGTGGVTAIPLYQKMGHEVIPLFCEMDSNFPNHHPDPTVEKNLKDLMAEVKKHKADLGIAFDGDADRIGVIDRDGEIIWGDRLLTLLARAVISEIPNATIIGEVKCSKTLYDDIAKHGGRPIMWRTGHSLIKAKMKETGAELGGEMSGHIFFSHRFYGFDDAVYTGGRLLEILGSDSETITQKLSDLPELVSTPEIRIDCEEKIKFDLVKKVTQRLSAQSKSSDFKVISIDGARAEWSDGWGLVRPSNTQPILVLRFEAKTKERLEQIREFMEKEIATAKNEL